LLTVGGADIDTTVDRSSVSSNAPVLSPGTTLRDALARMLASEAQVGVIVDGDRYLGVLTLSTIGRMIRDDT
jgi:CBS domain-containing protein